MKECVTPALHPTGLIKLDCLLSLADFKTWLLMTEHRQATSSLLIWSTIKRNWNYRNLSHFSFKIWMLCNPGIGYFSHVSQWYNYVRSTLNAAAAAAASGWRPREVTWPGRVPWRSEGRIINNSGSVEQRRGGTLPTVVLNLLDTDRSEGDRAYG